LGRSGTVGKRVSESGGKGLGGYYKEGRKENFARMGSKSARGMAEGQDANEPTERTSKGKRDFEIRGSDVELSVWGGL